MAVGWSRRREDDAEPTTPSTLRKVTGMRVEPDGSARVTLARISMEPVPHAPPDELQDDVIEPSAVFKPSTDWSNAEITVEYND